MRRERRRIGEWRALSSRRVRFKGSRRCCEREIITQKLQADGERALAAEFAFLRLFHFVTCASSLVPAHVRRVLTADVQTAADVEEFEPCAPTVCAPTAANETRVITTLSAIGERVVVDRVPPNEFRLDERLPPLAPHVERLVINVSNLDNPKKARCLLQRIEDEPLVLDCGTATDDVEQPPPFWHRDFRPLTARNLNADDKADDNEDDSEATSATTSRVAMLGSAGQLAFRRLRFDDAGLYRSAGGCFPRSSPASRCL